jgi:putative heme transporter
LDRESSSEGETLRGEAGARVILGRVRHRDAGDGGSGGETVFEIDPTELSGVFAAPRWLRDLGLLAWLLVGVIIVLVASVWTLGITATIVDPVLLGGILAIVTSPIVSRLKRHRVPRGLGAVVVLLSLLVIALLVVGLVVGGLVTHSGEITSVVNTAVDKVTKWFHDAGAGDTGSTESGIQKAIPTIGRTLINGVAAGITGIASIAFFLSFAMLSMFFLLKDGPTMRRWIDRHLGLPLPVAQVVTSNVIHSLRGYFVGVTIVAAFNGIVVALGALVLGVPLPGSIGVVSFVTAYVPYIGAIVAGFYAVLLALGAKGTTTALIMLVVVIAANGILQNIFQPIAFGAALDLHPLAVLVVTIGAGCLLGMVGLVLAAPLTSAAVHISRELGRARAQLADQAEPLTPPSAAPA